MKPRLAWGLVFAMMAAASIAGAENCGAAQIDLYGGSRGAVPFPHRRHQAVLEDCNLCHAVFPPQRNAIRTLVAEKRLKPKEVMNKQCIRCHRARKKAGDSSGPTTCSKCHTR